MRKVDMKCPLPKVTQVATEWKVRTYALEFQASSKLGSHLRTRTGAHPHVDGNLVTVAIPAFSKWESVELAIEAAEAEVATALEVIGTIEFLNAATLTTDPLAVRLLEVLAAKTDTEVAK